MAYITKANSKRILRKLDLGELDIQGRIYETPVYIFNKKEEQSLLAYKEFLKNPEKFVNEIYSKLPPKEDTFSWVYEGGIPCYHSSLECERLHSEFRNFSIPQPIKEQGISQVEAFRAWFKENEWLLDAKPDVFQYRLQMAWGIFQPITELKKDNSGVYEIANLDLTNLKVRLDAKIKEAGRYYYANSKHTSILKAYGKRTFLARYGNDFAFKDNHTGYSDEEVRKFLLDYEYEFKNPIFFMLQEYYRVKYNPELSMQGSLLEQLGFKECKHCNH